MNLNPICHSSPANKMKCFFLDYVHFWWSARLVDGLKPHLPLFSRQKNEMLIFWLCSTSDDWPGWLMDLNPIHHSSPAKKNEMLVFGLRSTSDDLPGWLMNLNLICHPSPPIKMKCSIFDYVQLLMISQAGQLTQSPSASPLQPIKWNASFWIMFTSDDQPGWLMDSNPIHHPSPAKKMKCSLLDYVHFGWSARLVDGLKPHPSPLSSQ